MGEDNQTDTVELSEEFSQNFLENTFDLFFDAELEKKGLDREDFRKGQVFFKGPFSSSQISEMDADESETEVRINDDADVKMVAKLKPGETIEKGEEIREEQLAGFEEILLDDEFEDFGHVTVADLGKFGFVYKFDLRRNRTYRGPLLDAADQFLKTAEFAFENALWRAFVENAFHATERLMKIDVIEMGKKAEQHSDVQSEYSALVKAGPGNDDLVDVYNKLHGKYRFSASYVDPKGDVEHKEFEIDKETADDFLEIIREHRENLKQ